MNNKMHYGTFLGQFFPRNMDIANDRVGSVPKQSREAIEQDIGSVSHPTSKGRTIRKLMGGRAKYKKNIRAREN